MSKESDPGIGPRADSVFPSLPAGGIDNDASPLASDEPIEAGAILLAHNIYTLTPATKVALDRARKLAEVNRSPDDYVPLYLFDQAEKDRVFQIAVQFVKNHARVVTSDVAVRTPNEDFAIGTVVISEDQIPKTRRRHATVHWAISKGRVVRLEGARLPVGHLGPITLKDQPSYRSPHHGDDSDTSFLLAFVCELLDFEPPSPIAATGTITLHTNDGIWEHDTPDLLDAARKSGIKDVIFPRVPEKDGGIAAGVHDGIDHWPAQDVDTAIVSMLTACTDGTLVPDLIKRVFTKQAYAWLSLVLILVAISASALFGSLGIGGHPPVTFARFLLLTIAVLFVGSMTMTHRFWRIDR